MLGNIDMAIGYGEDADVKIRDVLGEDRDADE